MNDAELEQIRQARMNELKGSRGGTPQPRGPGSDGVSQAQAQAQEEMRKNMMSQILLPPARERLSRISLVRPDKGTEIEELLIRLAQSGQLRGQVSDAELVQLLNQISRKEQQEQQSARTIIHRRNDIDSGDDFIAEPSKPATGDDDDDDFFD